MAKILMILTSHKEMEGQAKDTGVWLGEFTDPYYEFIDKGYVVTLASVKGGEPPVDSRSRLTENITPSNRRFEKDAEAKRQFKFTIPLANVDANDFEGIFYPGGHGPMWDLANDQANANLLIQFFEQEKPIGAVCHGPAALLKAAESKPEILKGRKVTAYTNVEEKAVALYDHIPFRLEDRLKELGADFHSATVPFTSNVEVDGLLITGQNPASAAPAAKKFIEHLEVKRASAELNAEKH